MDVAPSAMKQILLVDDEPSVMQSTEKFLTRMGYSVTVHETAESALALPRDMICSMECAIIDFHLPDISGVDLYAQLQAHHPILPVIFTSGFDLELLDDLQLTKNQLFLTKPFGLEEILTAIKRLTHAS